MRCYFLSFTQIPLTRVWCSARGLEGLPPSTLPLQSSVAFYKKNTATECLTLQFSVFPPSGWVKPLRGLSTPLLSSVYLCDRTGAPWWFFFSTNSLHKIIVFPNLHFNFIWAKLALELLHEIHVIVAKLSRCCFLEVVYPFLICIVHAPISDCYYTGIIKLLIHSPLKTEHLVPAFSFPCLWIAF